MSLDMCRLDQTTIGDLRNARIFIDCDDGECVLDDISVSVDGPWTVVYVDDDGYRGFLEVAPGHPVYVHFG